jgi:hypothetical protein
MGRFVPDPGAHLQAPGPSACHPPQADALGHRLWKAEHRRPRGGGADRSDLAAQRRQRTIGKWNADGTCCDGWYGGAALCFRCCGLRSPARGTGEPFEGFFAGVVRNEDANGAPLCVLAAQVCVQTVQAANRGLCVVVCVGGGAGGPSCGQVRLWATQHARCDSPIERLNYNIQPIPLIRFPGFSKNHRARLHCYLRQEGWSDDDVPRVPHSLPLQESLLLPVRWRNERAYRGPLPCPQSRPWAVDRWATSFSHV